MQQANKEFTGPSATYRGYRRQALYVLWRILCDSGSNETIYKPEGAEDLYLYKIDGSLLEAVQVKDISDDLTFSTFEPNKPKSFFYRVYERLVTNPKAENNLAIFGQLGPELDGVLGQTATKDRKNAATKLVEYSRVAKKKRDGQFHELTFEQASQVLSSINVKKISENTISQSLLTTLNKSIMGLNSVSALEMLLWWVFRASENSTSVTRESVLRKANEIGKALASFQSHHQEWHRSILPLSKNGLAEEQKKALADSFNEGVQATWQHILADVDVRRAQREKEIWGKFANCNIVILHGASGQGKSTLGYRFLFDYAPEGWRFQVLGLAGRTHALNVACALNSHASSMEIPAYVFIDVSPNDDGWVDLITQLSSNSKIKVLVVVREEDYRRAHFDPQSLTVEQVDLDGLNEAEGAEIFRLLTRRKQTNHFLNFSDAWAQFGGTGPLMEFTYIVNQGKSLKEKLRQQIERIQVDATNQKNGMTANHIDLLALVGVASAYECRLRTYDACLAANLTSLLNPFGRFEKEYLIRQFSEKNAVGGLHSIRSEMVLDLLFKDDPHAWKNYALRCIPLLFSSDLEGFLLRSFNRHPEYASDLSRSLLDLKSYSWEEIGGITRSLLWLGLSNYEKSNHETIQKLTAGIGEGWYLIFDSFLYDTGAVLKDIHSILIKRNTFYDALIRNIVQQPKENAFLPLKEWLLNLKSSPKNPETNSDWLGLAEVSFWIGYIKIDCLIKKQLESIPYDESKTLPLGDLATVIFCISKTNSKVFAKWASSIQVELKERFVNETASLSLEVSQQRAYVTFLIDVFKFPQASEADTGWHDQTMRRVSLMQSLFPNCDVYASQGLGFELLPFKMPVDPTQKNIPAKNLHAEKGVRLNATFGGLVTLRHLRPADWNDFIDHFLSMRTAVLNELRTLPRVLNKVMEKRDFKNIWKLISEHQWKETTNLIKVPALPKCAVDEWGYAAEGRANPSETGSSVGQRYAFLMTAYRPFLTAASDFTSNLNSFFTQFIKASTVSVALRMAKENDAFKKQIFSQLSISDDDDSLRNLALVNLNQAIEKLPEFQTLFRKFFRSRVTEVDLDELDLNERRTFSKAWSATREFLANPLHVVPDITSYATSSERNNEGKFLRFALEEFKTLALEGISCSIVNQEGNWCKGTALWLKASVNEPEILGIMSEKISSALYLAADACKLETWEAASIERKWHRIVLVPQFRGKSFSKSAYAALSFNFFQHGLHVSSPFHNAVLPSLPEDWEIELPIWNEPIAALTMRWLDFSIAFVFEFEKLRYLFIAINKAETTALDTLIGEVSKLISSKINPAIEAFEQLRDHLQIRSTSPSNDDRCKAIYERLVAWGLEAFPPLNEGVTQISIGPNDYLNWLEKVSAAMPEMVKIWHSICVQLLATDSEADN